ncbi:hypothetical protein IQ268_25210 [Oculatella sp. LEGE 06141]|uniref:hypothetical protein n=1 Tax=Oculatella sp. LEGE 06141 TaxID=1828648 RepID=UPI00188148AF|nr:hypothetical protein [Oculatella sp. LEGE 06141]
MRSPVVLSSFVEGAIAVVLIDGGFNLVPEGFDSEDDIASGQGADERLGDGPLLFMVNLLVGVCLALELNCTLSCPVVWTNQGNTLSPWEMQDMESTI